MASVSCFPSHLKLNTSYFSSFFYNSGLRLHCSKKDVLLSFPYITRPLQITWNGTIVVTIKTLRERERERNWICINSNLRSNWGKTYKNISRLFFPSKKHINIYKYRFINIFSNNFFAGLSLLLRRVGFGKIWKQVWARLVAWPNSYPRGIFY